MKNKYVIEVDSEDIIDCNFSDFNIGIRKPNMKDTAFVYEILNLLKENNRHNDFDFISQLVKNVIENEALLELK